MEKAGSANRKPDPIPLPPINEVFRLRVSGKCEEQLCVNTFCYRADNILPANATRTQVDAFFAEITAANGFLAQYVACLSADWTGLQLVVDLPTQPEFSPMNRGIATAVGGGPVGHCPTTVAVVVHKLSTFKGRHGRGRVGLPAVPITWVIGSSLDPAHTLPFTVFADAVATTLTDGVNTWKPGVLGIDKRTFPNEPAKWAWTWVDVLEGTFNPVLGNIRRRRPGRGK